MQSEILKKLLFFLCTNLETVFYKNHFRLPLNFELEKKIFEHDFFSWWDGSQHQVWNPWGANSTSCSCNFWSSGHPVFASTGICWLHASLTIFFLIYHSYVCYNHHNFVSLPAMVMASSNFSKSIVCNFTSSFASFRTLSLTLLQKQLCFIQCLATCWKLFILNNVLWLI